MSIRNIIGRSEEITRLDRCMEAISAQLIIIYGRRRVGKTYLINEYFNNEFKYFNNEFAFKLLEYCPYRNGTVKLA